MIIKSYPLLRKYSLLFFNKKPQPIRVWINVNIYKEGVILKESPKLKVRFYIISLMILFVLSMILDLEWKDKSGTTYGAVDLLCCNWFSIICLIMIILGLVFLLMQNHELEGALNPCCKITEIENVNYEFATFLTTYIIPLVCFDFDKERNKIVFMILLLIIGVIFVKMDLYLANPSLALLGYKLYRVSVDKGHENKDILVISKEKLSEQDSIEWLPMDKKCWYVKRK